MCVDKGLCSMRCGIQLYKFVEVWWIIFYSSQRMLLLP
jgi:hypothetical protein